MIYLLRNSHYCLILIVFYIIIKVKLKSIKVFVESENDLRDILENIDPVDEIEINIGNKSIDISNDINIFFIKNINKNEYGVKTLSINGISKESSILNFKHHYFGILYNNNNGNKNIKEIIIKNLTINGCFEFTNYKSITIENVVLYGHIISSFNNDFTDKNKNNDTLLNLINLFYNGSVELNPYLLRLTGNVIIKNSNFTGNPKSQNNLINYEGDNINKIEISDSLFDGVYSNICIDISNSYESVISSSSFEKCFGKLNGGGSIRTENSKLIVNNCKFKDSYSLQNGGIFYISEPILFNIQNIKVENSTSLLKGGFIHINSIETSQSIGYIKNVELDNIKSSYGSIASIEGISNLYIENIKGRNLYHGNGAFYLNYKSTIEIKNIELNNVVGKDKGGLLLTSENELLDSYFKVINGTFQDFFQTSDIKSTSFISSTKHINILLKE